MARQIITAEAVSKKYQIQQSQNSYETLRESLTIKAKSVLQRVLLRRNQSVLSATEELWALRDVSFEIVEGSRVGIIGANGAGKSTLLKILSRITEPTQGKITIRGRVASLLEVGTGFHSELSGRENIYLNGAILGMKRAEIRKKFDAIVAFSELEKFLDTPLKRFSSGMQMRLAFAVAAHLEPDILIVDEVLAVGDYRFQEKCIQKLNEIGANGRTIIFVSHDSSKVLSLCNVTFLMEKGQLLLVSDPETCISRYLGPLQKRGMSWAGPQGNRGFQAHRAHISTVIAQSERSFFYQGEELAVEFDYEVLEEHGDFSIHFFLCNDLGARLASRHLTRADASYLSAMRKGRHRLQLVFNAALVQPGRYTLSIQVSSIESASVLSEAVVLQFVVYKGGAEGHDRTDHCVVLGQALSIK